MKLEDIIDGIPLSPDVKIVATDDLKSCKDYECDGCDFKTNSQKKAVDHNQETRHEVWVKRK